MKCILSPAKNMRTLAMLTPEEQGRIADITTTTPYFVERAQVVAEHMKSLDVPEMAAALMIKEHLAAEAVSNWQLFEPRATVAQHNGLPAGAAYDGIAYKYLRALDFTVDQWREAQQRIRTIDATFGLVKPLDCLVPHRLDFTSKVSLEGAKTVYAWWGDTIARQLEQEAEGLIINTASAEYYKTISKYLSKHTRVIHCDFKIVTKGRLLTQGTWAKMARGACARYVVVERVETPEELKGFNYLGFEYRSDLSSDNSYVFVCEDPVLNK